MAGLWRSILRGKLGTNIGSGVMARVLMVETWLVLLQSFVLLLLVSLLLSRHWWRCFEGHFQCARLAGWRKWGLMLFGLIPLAFYHQGGVLHDTSSLIMGPAHCHCRWVPRYCYSWGTSSTWSGIVVCIDSIDGHEWPWPHIVPHPRLCQVVVLSSFLHVLWSQYRP